MTIIILCIFINTSVHGKDFLDILLLNTHGIFFINASVHDKDFF